MALPPTCAVKLPPETFREWLIPLRRTNRLKQIELDAPLLCQTDVQDDLRQHGIRCLSAPRLLSPETAEFLARHPDAFQTCRDALFNAMLCAETVQTELFPLQFPLETPAGPSSTSRTDAAAELLRTIREAPLETPPRLALEVRIPEPFPRSSEWAEAYDICRKANSPGIGLYLHFYADEFAEQHGSVRELLERARPFLQAVCFHYDLRHGELLCDDEQREWADALLADQFDGLILFAPRVAPEADLDDVCSLALSWADSYHG